MGDAAVSAFSFLRVAFPGRRGRRSLPQDRGPAQLRVVNKGQAGSQNRGDQNPTFTGGSERLRRRKGALKLTDVAGAANGQAFLAITLEILH